MIFPVALRSSNAVAQTGRSEAEGDGVATLHESRASPTELQPAKAGPPYSRERPHPSRSSRDDVRTQILVWRHRAAGAALPGWSEFHPARLRRAFLRILSTVLVIRPRSARRDANGWSNSRDLWLQSE